MNRMTRTPSWLVTIVSVLMLPSTAAMRGRPAPQPAE